MQQSGKTASVYQKMKENTGMTGGLFGLTDEEGLERKNPVIAALGDSVTAGHFET